MGGWLLVGTKNGGIDQRELLGYHFCGFLEAVLMGGVYTISTPGKSDENDEDLSRIEDAVVVNEKCPPLTHILNT